jgi:isopropylmalate/homocitrate/citramalate synthase
MVGLERKMADRVIIFDATLMRGEQSPGYSKSFGKKLRPARRPGKRGLDVINLAGNRVSSVGRMFSARSVLANPLALALFVSLLLLRSSG